MAPFDFRFDRESSIDDILALREVDFQNQKPGRFSITDNYLRWNHEILGALTEIFFYFHEKGIFWETLSVFVGEDNKRFIRPLIQQANDWKLFQYFDVSYRFNDDEGDEEEVDDYDLLPGITSNDRLEKVELECDGHLTGSHSRALNNILQTKQLNCLHLAELTNLDYRNLAVGLTNNTTLVEIFLFIQDCDITDEGIANIITSLTSHPNLQDLYVHADDQFGDLSARAIKMLLTESSSLIDLTLSDHRTLNTENILQGLKKSRSLKALRYFKALQGDLVFARLFSILQDCPTLEKLEIYDTSITTKDLEQVIHMKRLSKPIILEIQGDDPNSLDGDKFEQFLLAHPEVRLQCVHPDVFQDPSDSLNHVHNLNWYGRYLLDRGNDVPLSLWPLVFENANEEPSVIYEFLKGPAFAGREQGT